MKSCLLVDDSRVIRRFTRGIVEKLAFACRVAPDGESALSACAANMPGMSGIDCLKALRAMPGGDQPKVILCTINSEVNHIVEALEGGADEYIMKPFDADIVRQKFEQVGLL